MEITQTPLVKNYQTKQVTPPSVSEETAIATIGNLSEKASKVLVGGDLGTLTAFERIDYYQNVCHSLGLNPLTKPFSFILLNGKLTLYATRDAADQLRSKHKVSIEIVSREKMDDVYIVKAKATLPDGRVDESTGVVNLTGLKGDMLANVYMKAETKAKRRVTLSICGLGLLDETEVETIKDVKPFVEKVTTESDK